jgi:hypothetical protein
VGNFLPKMFQKVRFIGFLGDLDGIMFVFRKAAVKVSHNYRGNGIRKVWSMGLPLVEASLISSRKLGKKREYRLR